MKFFNIQNNIFSWVSIFFGLLLSILIVYCFLDIHKTLTETFINIDEPTYQGENIVTRIYHSSGSLNCQLSADHFQYFNNSKITWFTRPITTIFNENNVPILIMYADQAKLISDNILYFYGHVQINSINDILKLKQITSDNAIVYLNYLKCILYKM